MSRAALAAATQGSAAVAQLLQVASEGGGFGDEPVVALLAEALALSIDIHREAEVEACDTEYRMALEELRGAADAFIERWAG